MNVSRREILKAGLTATGLAALSLPALTRGALAQQPAELIIRNGLIVTAQGRMEADIRIRDEKIVEIGQNLFAAGATREIDARGMFLIPGAVDTHTHLNAEMPNPPRPNVAWTTTSADRRRHSQVA